LLTYKEGVEAFRVTDRLSDGDRAKLKLVIFVSWG
jgi:hypothetical protein